ncbi:Pentatricopeptide repeat-containing protein [Carex littledalei]|uniref:Pentatricopeptide repeat-containing protein n=1 Tax=Carex littledalei TaxID=544730 RepID=A0A833R2G5_9POAL|nr:Pentatricopeptide repeat-containing protein [Carex littledalei]
MMMMVLGDDNVPLSSLLSLLLCLFSLPLFFLSSSLYYYSWKLVLICLTTLLVMVLLLNLVLVRCSSAFFNARKLNTARAVLDEMPNKGIMPDIISYNEVLNGYLKKGDEPEFNEFLKLIYDKELSPNATTYNLRIQLHCTKGRCSEAEEVLEAMISKKINPNIQTLNNIIYGFCKEGQVGSALGVFKRMKEIKPVHGSSITPNYVTYKLLIKGLVDSQEFLPAVEVCKECAEKKWVPPFQAVRGLVEGLVNISQKEVAENLVSCVRNVVKEDKAEEWKKIEASFSF